MGATMTKANVFENIPPSFPQEIIDNLVEASNFRLERIVSQGHATPPGQWYDQPWDEWVILLSGSASLAFEGVDDTMVMQPGDFVHLPAHTRHRVEHTDTNQVTVWLALHYHRG
jgi:cupin 2 domain-containing protein